MPKEVQTKKKGVSRNPGRPRASGKTSEDVREEILVAAAKLFSAQGRPAVRIVHIAKEIGVRSPSIYYHFSDIDEIGIALIEFVVHDSLVFAVSVSSKSESPKAKLLQLLNYHLSRLINSDYDLWFIVKEMQNSEIVSLELQKEADQWREFVILLIDQGIKAREFAEVDRELALAMITGMIWGALALKNQGREVDPAEVTRLCIQSLSS